ncbi:MAG: hypothetical protein J4G13_04275 [Dehalococcoidia bacterium]|nr:hypothetical protein [Dehalococcoidia bacterium]
MSAAATYAETPDTPLTLLAKGEGLITDGQYREGSATVYQAAFTALREVAARRGWVCETHDDAHDVIYQLDGVEPPPESSAEAVRQAFERVNDPLPVYSTLFINVICFKLHGATTSTDGTLPVVFWEPEDYVRSLPPVKKFIELLAAEV